VVAIFYDPLHGRLFQRCNRRDFDTNVAPLVESIFGNRLQPTFSLPTFRAVDIFAIDIGACDIGACDIGACDRCGLA
jgi:hypothetical protein